MKNASRFCLTNLFFAGSITLSMIASALQATTPVRPMLEIDEAIFESYEGGVSEAQNVQPFAAQRGVGLDGSLRSQAPFGWAVNANPYSHEWNNNARYRDDIMLHTGRYSPTELDLALPAPGFRWTVGRTYSIPEDGGPSTGYQGHNWQQFSQPELVYKGMGTGQADRDVIYIVYGADRFLEFRELEEDGDVFRGVNGAAGAIVRGTVTGSVADHDVFVYWDRNGTRSTFFDYVDLDNNPTNHNADGQLWKIVDAADNTAYVGHETDPSLAITSGYDTNGYMQVAYDTAGRKYEYTYTSSRLTKVEAFIDDGMSGWDTTGAKVEYIYESTEKSGHYKIGDLTKVHVTMPLTDFDPDNPTTTPTVLYESYYQYHTTSSRAHFLRFVHNAEAVRRFDNATSSDSLFNYTGASDISPYSEINFNTYNTNGDHTTNIAYGKMLQTFWPGQTTISGSGSIGVRGEVNFDYIEYTTFANDNNTYNSEHASYTSVSERSSYIQYQYFDEAGQPLSRVVNPFAVNGLPKMWDYVSRDASAASSGGDDEPLLVDGAPGMINVHARPLSIETSDVNPAGNGSGYIPPCTVKQTSNKNQRYLVDVFPRVTTTTDPYFGFMESRSWQNGGSPNASYNDGPHKTIEYAYLNDVNRVELASEYYSYTPLISEETRYPQLNIGGSGQGSGESNDYTYVFHAEPLTGSSTAAVDDPQWLVPRQITLGLPAVPTSQLGSGISESEDIFLRADGTEIYHRNAEDVYSYTQIENGLSVRIIADADLGQTASFQTGEAPAQYWASVPSTSGAMHLINDWERDEIGRVVEETLPTGRVKEFYHTQLATGETVEVGSAKTVGTTHTGPGSYRMFDHAGNVIANAVFAINPDSEVTPGQTTQGLSNWVDSTAVNLLDSLDVGEFSEVMTYQYNETGIVVYTERSYHTLPTTGLGERFYNYDEELFGYGDMWRPEIHFEANGTIRYTHYDALGFPEEVEVGSYDPQWEPDANNITLGAVPTSDPIGSATDSVEEDLKPDKCCSLLTCFSGEWFAKGCNSTSGPVLTLGTGEQGVSYHQADLQQRLVFDFNPEAPHTFKEYDNLGRLISMATYWAVPTALDLVSVFPDDTDRDQPDIFTDFDSRTENPFNVSENRLSLVEYEYTPRGQLYKVKTHEIEQSGLNAGNSLDTVELIIGYDPVGRQIYSNNGQINKTVYDALGRITDKFTIAQNDDVLTDYSDLQDADSDEVIQETHYARNLESGNITLSVQVDRLSDIPLQASVLGPLDTNDYSDHTSITILKSGMKGRPQIVEYEYDDLDRPIERTIHGTGGTETANFSLASPPSGALVTSLEFAPSGRIETVTDPLLRDHKRSYDLAGRVTQVIENYVDSGTALDENRTTEYEYKNTQLRVYRAFIDANANPPTSQETIYTWGHYEVNDPDEETLVTGSMHDRIRRIKYPDGESEYYDYSIHGNMESFIDKAGNKFVVTVDDLYRPTKIDYATVQSDFNQYNSNLDDIEIAYNDRGLLSSVSQTTNGTIRDQVSFEYDGWGAIESFSQSHDWLESQASSAIELSTQYEWEASHGTGPSTLRMKSMTNPDGSVLENLFSGATNAALSRVLSMTLDLDGSGTTHSPVTVATYEYLGMDRVSKATYPENDVYSSLKDSNDDYDALDTFNRVTRSRWNRERASNEVPFYDTTIHWDAGSNITGITDHIFDDDFNFVFGNDDLDRLEQSKRGDGAGTAITTVEEQEDWVLSRIGNWDNHDLDLGDSVDWIDANEFKSQSTFSDLNEQTLIEYDRDDDDVYGEIVDDAPNPDIARVYDSNGNLRSDPSKGHQYKWDVLGRLVEVKDTSNTDTIAEFKYNALGYRIAERFDSTSDGKVDSNDTIWTRLIYDSRWRVVATYEVDVDTLENTQELTQRHVHHNAGLYGVGTGSYIDSVVLRDRDTDNDGLLEERHYYCQNFRSDVVAIVDASGRQIEQSRYSPYGVPFAVPYADQNVDGELDNNDTSLFTSRHNGSYDVRADTNLDGVLDFFDFGPFLNQYNDLRAVNVDIGRGAQSAYGHNRGYAGYWFVPELGLSHIRNRWYDPDQGVWLSIDPSGYTDGASLFGYIGAIPLTGTDPLGLFSFKDFVSGNTKVHSWVAKNYWGKIYTNQQLAGFSDTRVVAESVGHAVVWAAVIRAGGPRLIKLVKPKPVVQVTRWGRPGLKNNDWVMKGGNTWWNYIKSGKYQPRSWPGNNIPASRCSGQSFWVPRSSLKNPKGLEWIKGPLLGQRIFKLF